MEVKIEIEKNLDLIITEKGLNGYGSVYVNFVKKRLDTEGYPVPGSEETMVSEMVSVEDLYSAAKMFEDRRRQKIQKEPEDE